MKAVLHFPVAWQYPSRTETTSSFASNRISGISGRLPLVANLDVTRRPQRFSECRAQFGDSYRAVCLAFDGNGKLRADFLADADCLA